MKKAGLIAGFVAVLLVAASLVALVFLSRSSSHPFADPADARCNAPTVSFDSAVVSLSHREFGVRFTCVGAQIAGTLDVPRGRGPFPAVVWVHGAGESARLLYDAPLVQALVDSGIAVLSYDKRGVGESEGECCPGDYGQFNLLAADVDGAVAALRARTEIDPSRIGLLGASQAGWVVPLAAVRSEGQVAFTALVDAPTVSTGEEDLCSQGTGEQGSVLRLASFVRTAGGLRSPGPAGFDPRTYLEQLETPGLWLYGGADRSQPTEDDVDVLKRLKARGKDFSVLVYPQAGHGLLDVPPTDPRALPEVVRWIKARTATASL
ncbi:MAG TPA: alpha/beta fold hydrolase [Gaiellaceae bacterium]